MMKINLKWSYFIGLLLFLVILEAHASITANLDRYQVNEGESVHLTIEAEGQLSVMPNTDALNNDFDVMGVASGSRVNIINGRVNASTTWNISLMPKRSGELTIPSLTINGEQTPVLALQVNEASTSLSSDATTPVFIETEVDKMDPYVQGMVLYTMRVFYKVDLANASLSDPQSDNALIHRMGEDRNYTEVRNGMTYLVVERQYAVFPQISGELVLVAPILDGQIPVNTSQRDHFFNRMMMQARPIRLRGEPYQLSVRPRSDQNASAHWLPAESVELTETWEPAQGGVTVSEPLTRIITIKASAMIGEQLPDLKFPDIDGFKIYPDPAQPKTHDLVDNVSGEKTLRLAYLPAQPGTYTLPSVTLHWWDTKTDQQRVATLPERVVEVKPAKNTLQSPTQLTPVPGLNDSMPTEQSNNMAGSNQLTLQPGEDNVIYSKISQTIWFWVSLTLAALWLLTLGFWWRHRRASIMEEESVVDQAKPENIHKARKHFLSACSKNDSKLARQALLQWAAVHWPQSPPVGLDELALRLDDEEASAVLTALDSALYQHKAAFWDGKKLAQVIKQLPELERESDDKVVLPRLYVQS